MAITPAAGWMIDPNNPNAVVPIGSSAQAQGLGTYSTPTPTSPTVQQPPITSTPTAPTVQPPAPAAPQAAPTQPTSPVTVNVGTATPQAGTQPQAGPLKYDPAVNPSVIDLLNQTGADSSKQGRTALAGQLGVQNYDFSAAKNMELAKKYTEMYNAKKATAVPQNQAEAMQQAQTYAEENKPQQSIEDTQKAFFDNYMSMNPVMKTVYDNINSLLSSTGTSTTFKEEYANLFKEQGIPALQTEYMNIKNIMDGTEDDIRNEITKAGGFATESQVQALKGARNKVLLKQANVIQQQLALKEDYVDQLMKFSQLDRKQVSDDLDRKLGLTEKLADIQEKMTTAAHDNYQKVVEAVGYQGLADALGGDKGAQKAAEQSLGLPNGALSNPTFLSAKKVSTGSMSGSIQEYEYAKAQGYKGSFTDYQNEDANRKKSIAAAGAGGLGLTPAQINSTVNTIAGAFDNEQIVKSYNTVQEGFQTIKTIGVDTKSPADDIAFIYAFAKIMDPNSVVREGEYNTIQKYAQTWADNFGFTAQRIFSNTNFLTSDAKQKMLNALAPKVQTITNQYKNLQSEYQRQVNDAYLGKPRQITNYSVPVTEVANLPKDGDTKMYNGVEYIYNGSGWVKKGAQPSSINWAALTMKK